MAYAPPAKIKVAIKPSILQLDKTLKTLVPKPSEVSTSITEEVSEDKAEAAIKGSPVEKSVTITKPHPLDKIPPEVKLEIKLKPPTLVNLKKPKTYVKRKPKLNLDNNRKISDMFHKVNKSDKVENASERVSPRLQGYPTHSFEGRFRNPNEKEFLVQVRIADEPTDCLNQQPNTFQAEEVAKGTPESISTLVFNPGLTRDARFGAKTEQ